jgi:predicted PurR-regulated permease PerM
VRLAIPIGLCAGALNFVPYLGSAFALVSGLLMSLVGGGDWPQLLGVVIAYALIQAVEGFVITPRVIGNAVGLRDVWVLLALFVCGELFGFLGVLLALPLAAVTKIFVARAVEHGAPW